MRNCPTRVLLFTSCAAATASVAAGPQKRVVTPKITEETVVRSTEIPSKVEYQLTRDMSAGRILKVRAGAPGKLVKTYRIRRTGKKILGKEVIGEERIEPTTTLYRIGKRGFATDRSGFVRSKVLSMHATGYDPHPAGGTGRTRLGYKAGFGHVAVDPRVIKLGSMVFVEGYGLALASDTGSAIKGNRIDLCFPTRSKAFQFGRRQVKVHVLRAG